MPRYCAYGIYIQTNLPIRALAMIPGKVEGSDTRLVMGQLPGWLAKPFLTEDKPWYVSDCLDEWDRPSLIVWSIDRAGGYLYFRYPDETEFVVSRDGSEIWAAWSDKLTVEDTLTYLLGPVFGVLLRLKGTICLHASAILIEDKVVVLVGDSGAGKSTTAAAFAQRGYPVLSDDVVALVDRGDRFLVQPAYPRIRLWKESVAALYGSPEALPLIVPTNPTWDKRYLDLTQPGYSFPATPLPIGAIYFLGNRSSRLAVPKIEAIATQQQLISLLGNTYASRFIDKTMRAQEFEVLSRIVQQVRIRQITPHCDLACLPLLLDTIIEDLQGTVIAQLR